MLKNKKSTFLITGMMAIVGLVIGIATMAKAQSLTTSTPTDNNTNVTTQTITDTPESGDVTDATGAKTEKHAPLGGDGVVSSINGSFIVMSEESNEGGSSYTVDASSATVTNNGAPATLADVKVGEKIFVEGTTNGISVVATSISIGHKGEHADKANDADGSAESEASEPASGTGAQGGE